jgi:hypothetical protein
MVQTAVKIIFFVVFTAILYFVINFVLTYFKNIMHGVVMLNNINYFFCWLGVYQALNLLISMTIGNWIITKIVKYASY